MAFKDIFKTLIMWMIGIIIMFRVWTYFQQFKKRPGGVKMEEQKDEVKEEVEEKKVEKTVEEELNGLREFIKSNNSVNGYQIGGVLISPRDSLDVICLKMIAGIKEKIKNCKQ